MAPVNDGALRRVLEEARAAKGLTMDALTVLAAANDPYRQDTEAGHRLGKWFAKHFTDTLAQCGKSTLHLRGVHYIIAMAAKPILKPDGQPYRNSHSDWLWLEGAAKCARWLGYVEFDAILDHRADPPIIRPAKRASPPYGVVATRLGIEIPDPDPVAVCHVEARQPYRLVIFGEKSSLADVVRPIADRYDADLFLEKGEISDSHIYQMAAAGDADGRPLRVFTLSDCDPAGWQMPVSIGRKLQAFRSLKFHDLDFEVIPVALTVDQVRELGLPSTPLKDSEKRGDQWRAAFGIEQTEIDALGTLRSAVLAGILRTALDRFFDATLEGRIDQAVRAWRQRAQGMIDTQLDGEALEEIRGELDTLRASADDIEARLHEMTADIKLPRIVTPKAAIDRSSNGHQPLVSSAWDWAEQTQRLKARKAYEPAEDER